MKKRKRSSPYSSKLKLNKLENIIPGREIIIRRVRKVGELENWEIQILVKELDWKKSSLTYAVIGYNLEEAIDKL